MDVESGVDRFSKILDEVRHMPKDADLLPGYQQFIDDYTQGIIWDTLLFALDDLQRQIDELKEEAR